MSDRSRNTCTCRKPTSVNETAHPVPNASPIEQGLQESIPKVCCRRAYEHDSFCLTFRAMFQAIWQYWQASKTWGLETNRRHANHPDVTKWVTTSITQYQQWSWLPRNKLPTRGGGGRATSQKNLSGPGSGLTKTLPTSFANSGVFP